MPTVYIAVQHRDLSGGVDRVEVDGATVAQVIASLDREFPGMAARLRDSNGLTPGLAVSIDGAFSSRGLWAKVAATSEIHFLPALGGG